MLWNKLNNRFNVITPQKSVLGQILEQYTDIRCHYAADDDDIWYFATPIWPIFLRINWPQCMHFCIKKSGPSNIHEP